MRGERCVSLLTREDETKMTDRMPQVDEFVTMTDSEVRQTQQICVRVQSFIGQVIGVNLGPVTDQPIDQTVYPIV